MQFDCTACAREQKHGGDLKGEHSGSPRSCDGPRLWPFHGGAFTWKGCPRRSLSSPQVRHWLRLYERTRGEMTWSEVRRATPMLLDVLGTLDRAADLNAEAERKNLGDFKRKG